MRTSFQNATQTVQLFRPLPEAVYSIEAVANITGIPRRTILVYCKHHLVSPVAGPGRDGFYFDKETIRRLRQIENLRAPFGCNVAGLEFMLRLLDEVERLQQEQEFFPA